MTFNDDFATDLRLSEAPTGVIVNALRWDILNDWVRYLKDDKHPDKTAEMAYVWGFINRDFGGDALRCLWGKHETNYPMFAEAVWLLHREFSEGAGVEGHPLFAGLPPIPADVLFRKIANVSAVAFRKLTADQMVEILRKAPQDYAGMG
ncbi:hypothetical protein AB0E08_09000 [Streptomyces sp. NPDC048281]|uniref:hypothetical protein n=1 Tax=Streptomyces sp. NPDC048281 TaxID=3154715 RepID=UPI0034243175